MRLEAKVHYPPCKTGRKGACLDRSLLPEAHVLVSALGEILRSLGLTWLGGGNSMYAIGVTQRTLLLQNEAEMLLPALPPPPSPQQMQKAPVSPGVCAVF